MKVGEVGLCVDCKAPGMIVSTSIDGSDFDVDLARRSSKALEPSAYSPLGLTCSPCEANRVRLAMPPRGVCPACGKDSKADLGATRSFCGDACINAFLERHLKSSG